jgi:hypothetical protein
VYSPSNNNTNEDDCMYTYTDDLGSPDDLVSGSSKRLTEDFRNLNNKAHFDYKQSFDPK